MTRYRPVTAGAKPQVSAVIAVCLWGQNKAAPAANRGLATQTVGGSNVDDCKHTQIDYTPTSVYRYFDSAGVLLYVGITSRGAARNSEHNKGKEWWPYVARQEVSHYRTRTTALNIERELIRHHRPPFNVQHNIDHADVRAAYLAFRDRNVPISSQTLMARAVDSPIRFSLDVVSAGRGVVVLTSRPGDVLKVAGIDLTNDRYDVGSAGRGARVQAVGIEQGMLRVIVRIKDAADVGGADVLLRQASQKGGRTSLKRIDLYLPPRTKATRRRNRNRAGGEVE